VNYLCVERGILGVTVLSYDVCNIFYYVSITSPLNRQNFNVAKFSICNSVLTASFDLLQVYYWILWILFCEWLEPRCLWWSPQSDDSVHAV